MACYVIGVACYVLGMACYEYVLGMVCYVLGMSCYDYVLGVAWSWRLDSSLESQVQPWLRTPGWCL